MFFRSPKAFPSDAHKITYIIYLLRHRALKWPETFFDNSTAQKNSLDDFLEFFTLTFAPVKNSDLASRQLWSLKQGNGPVADFAVEFCTLAAESEWNDPLNGAFYNALNERMKDELASRD